ncbi:MAG: C40 family peptidase [Clostridiales bacterium]|nr:C40 family peptidase [Clostridiales bacterium]
MNKDNTNRKLGTRLVAIAATITLITSCGSKRTTVKRHVPQAAGEITLEQLLQGNAGNGYVIGTDIELSSRARAVVDAAQRWLGTSYKYGGETKRGVDCSALVMNVYKESLGIKIPRTTAQQRKYASNVSRKDLQPGDLIFFSSNKNRNGISHVGLFIGNDRFIHASSSRGVVVSKLSEKYFMNHYHSSGRITDMGITVASHDVPTDSHAYSDSLQAVQALMLEEILTATIDSIYSMPVDNDPNLAPGL